MPKVSVGEHTQDTLNNLTSELELIARGIAGVRDSLATLKIESVSIQGQAEMVRAVDRLSVFLQNAEKAVRKIRSERGGYGTEQIVDEPDEPAPANGRSKSRAKRR